MAWVSRVLVASVLLPVAVQSSSPSSAPVISLKGKAQTQRDMVHSHNATEINRASSGEKYQQKYMKEFAGGESNYHKYLQDYAGGNAQQKFMQKYAGGGAGGTFDYQKYMTQYGQGNVSNYQQYMDNNAQYVFNEFAGDYQRFMNQYGGNASGYDASLAAQSLSRTDVTTNLDQLEQGAASLASLASLAVIGSALGAVAARILVHLATLPRHSATANGYAHLLG